MTTESKMTTENIFRKMYNQTIYWNDFGDIPYRMKGKGISSVEVWLMANAVSITYEEFEYFIKEILKLSKQHRIIRETWHYFIRQGFIVEREVNQHKKTHNLILIEIREMLSIDGPKEMSKIRGEIIQTGNKAEAVRS